MQSMGHSLDQPIAHTDDNQVTTLLDAIKNQPTEVCQELIKTIYRTNDFPKYTETILRLFQQLESTLVHSDLTCLKMIDIILSDQTLCDIFLGRNEAEIFGVNIQKLINIRKHQLPAFAYGQYPKNPARLSTNQQNLVALNHPNLFETIQAEGLSSYYDLYLLSQNEQYRFLVSSLLRYPFYPQICNSAALKQDIIDLTNPTEKMQQSNDNNQNKIQEVAKEALQQLVYDLLSDNNNSPYFSSFWGRPKAQDKCRTESNLDIIWRIKRALQTGDGNYSLLLDNVKATLLEKSSNDSTPHNGNVVVSHSLP